MENDLYVDSLIKADSLAKVRFIQEVEQIEQLDNTTVVVFILLFIATLYIILKNTKNG
tara:strand:+ start:59 stop:232 length:174 start_codon:yes stop_codon:yes gene_type:complete